MGRGKVLQLQGFSEADLCVKDWLASMEEADAADARESRRLTYLHTLLRKPKPRRSYSRRRLSPGEWESIHQAVEQYQDLAIAVDHYIES